MYSSGLDLRTLPGLLITFSARLREGSCAANEVVRIGIQDNYSK